jgi:hypothetical protein
MRRVIVAVPFLTITEQNAAVYRRLLDEEGAEPVVLEHHSQADFDTRVRWEPRCSPVRWTRRSPQCPCTTAKVDPAREPPGSGRRSGSGVAGISHL